MARNWGHLKLGWCISNMTEPAVPWALHVGPYMSIPKIWMIVIDWYVRRVETAKHLVLRSNLAQSHCDQFKSTAQLCRFSLLDGNIFLVVCWCGSRSLSWKFWLSDTNVAKPQEPSQKPTKLEVNSWICHCRSHSRRLRWCRFFWGPSRIPTIFLTYLYQLASITRRHRSRLKLNNYK